MIFYLREARTSIIIAAVLRKLLSRATGLAAKIPIPPPLRASLYGSYARRYSANLGEAERSPREYRSFDDFFTRRLRPGSRSIDPAANSIVSPVDGSVSACGAIEGNSLFQAKGLSYSLRDLFGGDSRHAGLEGGYFLTLYLAPGDCHRVHAPLDIEVLDANRIGGTLRPVRTKQVQTVPNLFCENERVACFWKTSGGSAAFVLVGALNVGSVELLCKPGAKAAKGKEIAVFHLGSTVILLLPKGKAALEKLSPGDRVRIGQRVGVLT